MQGIAKGEILNTFIAQIGYHRKYAITVLKNWGKTIYVKVNGKPIKLIAGDVEKTRSKIQMCHLDLKKRWYIFDCMRGKRMTPAMQKMLPILEKFGEIRPSLKEISQRSRINYLKSWHRVIENIFINVADEMRLPYVPRCLTCHRVGAVQANAPFLL